MKLPLKGLVPRWMPLLLGALIVIGIAFDMVTRSELSATTALICEGEYADTLQVQSARTRDIEQGAKGQFSYLVRSSAKYECPFFGPDGKLRRRRVQASELGTAFGYEISGSDTYLLTNEHVAAWPDVTDTFHRIDGIPEGCKRVEDKLRIVRDERDDFEPGQIVLSRVAVDPLLDAAILKASQKLTVLPYKIGKSAALRQGNAVEVRGFPLGRHAGGLGRQGGQPLRPRSRTGVGPRRLRHRRAPRRGELGEPGAGGVVQVARSRAGRRLSRRLQGAWRAERGGRHRPAHRVHAQEAAPPARLDRRWAGRPLDRRSRADQGGARGGDPAPVRLRRPLRPGRGGGRRPPLSLLWPPVPARRSAGRRPRRSRQGRGLRGDRAVLGARADGLARMAAVGAGDRRARFAGACRRLDPAADPAHRRLPEGAGQPWVAR